MYYAVEMCSNEYSLNGTIRRDVRTRKFRHLHLHHFVCLPHHYRSLESSRTFQDLVLKFPALSRTKPIFQDFPGPGNCTQKNPGLSRTFQERGNPGQETEASTIIDCYATVRRRRREWEYEQHQTQTWSPDCIICTRKMRYRATQSIYNRMSQFINQSVNHS